MYHPGIVKKSKNRKMKGEKAKEGSHDYDMVMSVENGPSAKERRKWEVEGAVSDMMRVHESMKKPGMEDDIRAHLKKKMSMMREMMHQIGMKAPGEMGE